MTRYISPTNLTYLSGAETALCKCVKLTLRDGSVQGFTDHDANLTISAVTYRAKGLAVGHLRWSNRLDNEPTELRGLFGDDTGELTEADARLGLYNEALCEIYLVRWDTAAVITHLKRGYVQEVTPEGAGYVMSVRSMAAPLAKKKLLRVIGRLCDADLGDARCGVSVTTYTGTADGGASLTQLTDVGFTAPGDVTKLVGGKLVLTSGDLAWHRNQIKSYDDGSKTFTFVKPWPAAVAAGVTFTAYEGCPKTAAACKTRFSNLVNFRGYPHVPDRDNLAFKVYPADQHGGYAVGNGEAP